MMAVEIRHVEPEDIPFLWQMLYYAAHMSEDGARSALEAQDDPRVNIWVLDWGRVGDRGVIAYDLQTGRRLGAAWLRVWDNAEVSSGFYDAHTPELAIAVQPECTGQGIGAAMLNVLIERVRGEMPGIALTVREGNPARRLYERFGFIETDEVTNRVGTKSSKMLLRFEKVG